MTDPSEDHATRVREQIEALTRYANAVHPPPKHPAPGCLCHACAARDERDEAMAEARAEERMTGREADRRADLMFGDLT